MAGSGRVGPLCGAALWAARRFHGSAMLVRSRCAASARATQATLRRRASPVLLYGINPYSAPGLKRPGLSIQALIPDSYALCIDSIRRAAHDTIILGCNSGFSAAFHVAALPGANCRGKMRHFAAGNYRSEMRPGVIGQPRPRRPCRSSGGGGRLQGAPTCIQLRGME